MEQIGFFEAAPAVPPPRPRGGVRRNDPESSHIAADMVESFGGTHRELILSALRKFGPMTVDQIAARTPLMSQQVNKRLPELERDEVVRVATNSAGQEVMRESLSGRPERVWEAV
jgi:predicted ArsR family transcriptional regulator